MLEDADDMSVHIDRLNVPSPPISPRTRGEVGASRIGVQILKKFSQNRLPKFFQEFHEPGILVAFQRTSWASLSSPRVLLFKSIEDADNLPIHTGFPL